MHEIINLSNGYESDRVNLNERFCIILAFARGFTRAEVQGVVSVHMRHIKNLHAEFQEILGCGVSGCLGQSSSSFIYIHI